MKKSTQGIIALAAVMAIGMAAPSGTLLAGPYGGLSYADCSVGHEKDSAKSSCPACSSKQEATATLKEAAKALRETRPDLAGKLEAIAAARK